MGGLLGGRESAARRPLAARREREPDAERVGLQAERLAARPQRRASARRHERSLRLRGEQQHQRKD